LCAVSRRPIPLPRVVSCLERDLALGELADVIAGEWDGGTAGGGGRR
jgi:hypothetical protein